MAGDFEGPKPALASCLSAKTCRISIKVAHSVTVEYTGLTVDAQAATQEQGNPSVLNSAKRAAEALACCLPPPPTLRVLTGVSGKLVPGRLTLLLGPPGSGKSLFMRTLAGRLHPAASGSGLAVQGSVTYNGVPVAELESRRIAGLVLQQDCHISNLTVLETIEFAADCMLGAADAQQALATLPDGSAAKLTAAAKGAIVRRLRPELVLSLLGLDTVADTIIGDNMLRGVSGGQRKRVTLGEQLAGSHDVLLMDEISTGLDSATTYSVVQVLAGMAHALDKTILVSMLQPQAEAFYLFDDVIMLAEGRVCYQGPTAEVLAHFEGLGFVRPESKDPASFLLELTTVAGQLTYADPGLLERKGVAVDRFSQGGLLEHVMRHMNDPPLVSMEEMGAPFSAATCTAVECEEGAATATSPPPNDASWVPKGRYARSLPALILVILQRQIRLDFNQKGLLVAQMLRIAILGIIYGTVYAFTPTASDGRVALGLISSAVVSISFSALSQIGWVFSTKKTLLRHLDAQMFPTMALVLGSFLPQLPITLVEIAVYAPIVYFVAGFYLSASGFFTFYLVLWSVRVSMATLFRLAAFFLTSPVACSAATSIFLSVGVIFNGFVLVSYQIPDYLIWILWLNPVAWAVRALSISELTSPAWSAPAVADPSVSEGVYVLQTYGFYTEKYWIWLGVAALWGFTLVYSALSCWALAYARPAPQT